MRRYTVTRYDTLRSIALKFDIPVAWLRQLNGMSGDVIFPGEELVVAKPAPLASVEPYDASLIDITSFRELSCGHVVIVGDTFRFECPPLRPIVRSLAAAKDSSCVGHPDGQRTILTVTFDEEGERVVLYAFAGKKDGLERFHARISGRIGLKRQSEMRSLGPARTGRVRPSASAAVVPQVVDSGGMADTDLVCSAPAEVFASFSQMPLREPPAFHWLGGESEIIGLDDMKRLRSSLPARARAADWRRCFSLSFDGTGRLTFRERIRDRRPVVCLVRTTAGDGLGAFVPAGIDVSASGGGEVALFRLGREFGVFWKRRGAMAHAYCSTTDSFSLSIGGGGAAALWVDNGLMCGVSEPCMIFGSPGLASAREWRVANLEVWWLDPSTFNV